MTTTPLREITFSPERAVESLLYSLQKLGGQADIHTLLKVRYFADLHHIVEFGGRTGSGDEIKAMKYGPVPDRTYKLLQAAAGKESDYIPPHFYELAEASIDGAGYPMVIRPRRAPDMSRLTPGDVESLDAAVALISPMDFDQRTLASHDEAWTVARQRWMETGDLAIRLEDMIGMQPEAAAILDHLYADA
jgi:hypothetical protein